MAAAGVSAIQLDGSPSPCARVREAKSHLATCQARVSELSAVIQQYVEERKNAMQAAREAEAELDAALAAPVLGGRDPTESLPDELMLHVLTLVGFLAQCRSVCSRWRRLCCDPALRHRAFRQRWLLHAAAGGDRYRRSIDAAESSGVLVSGIAYGGHVDMVGSIDSFAGITLWSPTGRAVHQHNGLSMRFSEYSFCRTSDSVGNVYTILSHDSSTVEIIRRHNATRRRLRTVKDGDDYYVSSLAITDGPLVSGHLSGDIFSWNVESRTVIHNFQGHTRRVHTLLLADNTLYSASTDGTLRVWDMSNGAQMRSMVVPTDVHAIAVSPGRIYSATESAIQVWGTDGALIHELANTAIKNGLAVIGPGVLVAAERERLVIWLDGVDQPPLEITIRSHRTLRAMVSSKNQIWVAHSSAIEIFE